MLNMGKILDRLRGKSLQNDQGIIAKIKARRQQSDNGGGYGGGVANMVQSTAVDVRTTVHDAIEDMAQEDGVLKKGLVSNIIPHIRSTRFIPPPPEVPATTDSGQNMNIPAPIPPRNLQVPVEDTRPLRKKKGLQYQTEDIRVLGGQYEININ